MDSQHRNQNASQGKGQKGKGQKGSNTAQSRVMRQAADSASAPIVRDLLLSALLFLLMWEWVRPLRLITVTDIAYVWSPLLLSIALFLLFDALHVPKWWSWIGKLLLCTGLVSYLYDQIGFPWNGAYLKFIHTEGRDALYLLGGHIGQISMESRTLLFFIGWCLLIHVMQALALERQHGMWLVALTLIYLIVLHLCLGLDLAGAMIRTLLIGLLWVSHLHRIRLERWFRTSMPSRFRSGAWTGGSLLIIAVVLLFGWFASSSRQKINEPIDWNRYEALLQPLLSMQSFETASSWVESNWQQLEPSSAWGANRVSVMNAHEPLGSKAVSGFSLDDSLLGGALTQDRSVAFTARTPVLTYWRVESKNVYDGRGWTASPTVLLEGALHTTLPSSSTSDASRRRIVQEEILLNRSGLQGRLVYGGSAIQRVDELITNQSGSAASAGAGIYSESGASSGSGSNAVSEGTVSPDRILVDTADNRYTLDDKTAQPLYYKIDAVLPLSGTDRIDSSGDTAATKSDASDTTRAAVFSAEGKGTSSGSAPDSPSTAGHQAAGTLPDAAGTAASRAADSSQLPAAFYAEYLQLPQELPSRVGQLAQQITAGAVSDTERARLIALYLDSHYRYSLNKAKIPPANEDFVDYFLFHSKTGYCDYFSSAMTILLRTAGVPARWVKGFAPGTVTGKHGPLYDVTVRNSDAHSWVEAYIQGKGWTLFDPTPGFSSDVSASGSADSSWPSFSSSSTQIAGSYHRTGVLRASDVPGRSSGRRSIFRWIALQQISRRAGLTAVCCAAMLLLVGLYLRIRRKQRVLESDPPLSQDPLHWMDHIWEQLFRKYGAKEHGQTIREYTDALKSVGSKKKHALAEFLEAYERMRYDRASLMRISKRKRNAWQKLLK